MHRMYETTIYYAAQESYAEPFQARFHVLAESEAHAATLARAAMRQAYPGEVHDSAYLARGATWLVPGVTRPKRVSVPVRRH